MISCFAPDRVRLTQTQLEFTSLIVAFNVERSRRNDKSCLLHRSQNVVFVKQQSFINPITFIENHLHGPTLQVVISLMGRDFLQDATQHGNSLQRAVLLLAAPQNYSSQCLQVNGRQTSNLKSH